MEDELKEFNLVECVVLDDYLESYDLCDYRLTDEAENEEYEIMSDDFAEQEAEEYYESHEGY